MLAHLKMAFAHQDAPTYVPISLDTISHEPKRSWVFQNISWANTKPSFTKSKSQFSRQKARTNCRPEKGKNLWLAISLKNGEEREAACSTFPMYFVLETYFQGLRFSLGSSNRRQIVQLKPLSLLAALISLVEPKLFMFHLILCKGGWRWKKYQVLCHLLLPFSHFVLSRSIEGLQKNCIQLEFSASKNCFEAAGEAGNEILWVWAADDTSAAINSSKNCKNVL